MKPVSTTTMWKPRKQQDMKLFLLTRTENFCTHPSAWKVILTLLDWTTGNFVALHTQEGTVTSEIYVELQKIHLRPAINSKQHGLLSAGIFSYVTMLSSILPFELMWQSKISPWSAFHIRRTHQTSLPVNFIFLEIWKRQCEESLSGLTRCSRRWNSGCFLSQKNFF